MDSGHRVASMLKVSFLRELFKRELKITSTEKKCRVTGYPPPLELREEVKMAEKYATV